MTPPVITSAGLFMTAFPFSSLGRPTRISGSRADRRRADGGCPGRAEAASGSSCSTELTSVIRVRISRDPRARISSEHAVWCPAELCFRR